MYLLNDTTNALSAAIHSQTITAAMIIFGCMIITLAITVIVVIRDNN